MSTQEQSLFGRRDFRIGVLAAVAIIVLAAAAYFFGTGLRADTAASVAPSPLGSSLTAVRASTSEDYVGRLINSAAASRAASLAALAQSRSDFHAEQSNSAAASRASSAAASRFGDRYDRMNSSSTAERSALLDMIERSGSANYSERAAGLWFDIPAAGSRASQPSETSSRSSLAELAEIWAPFYAGLDKAMTDAGARPAPGTSSSMVESSTQGQFQWVKPEGINPSEAANSAAEQSPWIKPEGIRAN